jgi:long-chain acyl-CoA synthetase
MQPRKKSCEFVYHPTIYLLWFADRVIDPEGKSMIVSEKERTMEKLWLKNYEKGVPEVIDPDVYSSLVELAQESFHHYAQQPCYTNLGAELTFQQTDNLSTAFAGFLQKSCKLAPGERVVIMLPNVLQYPVVMFGILKAKMTVVNVNPLYTARELKQILQDSGAKCVVVLANFAHVLAQALPDTQVEKVVVTELGDLLGCMKGTLVNFVVKHIKKLVPKWQISSAVPFKETIAKKYKLAFVAPKIVGSDIAYLQYTGGTTGGLKGAMLSHRNMVANVLQASAWVQSLFKQKCEGGIITALPLYHIFSLTANCLTFLRAGVANILITNPRDIPSFVKELKRQPFCFMTGVNTLFNALLHNEEFRKLDFSGFKFTLGGGMAVQKPVAMRWHEVTGIPLLEAYGLTETSPAVTINPLYLNEYNGSIGLPVSSTEVKVINDSGEELAMGERGELCIRGPQVMQGYWNQPEKTAEVLDSEGWLRTGDIARIDNDGFVYIVDRKKDMILVSGFNVYPNEVEEVIAGIPGIREVAVIGIPAAEQGEVVKAFIVRSDPTITAEAVIAHCHKELTGYKVPKEIEFRKELPKTNVGKVMRRALREEETERQARLAKETFKTQTQR